MIEEEEQKKEYEKEKNMNEIKKNEILKLRELIKAEKNRIKICYLCKRKFFNAINLTNHEKSSELHKRN